MHLGLPRVALVASYGEEERPELVCPLCFSTGCPLLWHAAVRSLYHMPVSHASGPPDLQNYEPKTSILSES